MTSPRKWASPATEQASRRALAPGRTTTSSGPGANATRLAKRIISQDDGGIFVEYLLLMTIVGIGGIAGLAVVRGALLNELLELASAISAIVP